MVKINESGKLKGHIKITKKDSNGNVVLVKEVDNVIVNVGKNALATWLATSSPSGYFMRYIAVGEGTTPAQATDTALEDELSPRVAATVTSDGNVLQLESTFGPGVCTGELTESGIFNASSGGTMFARQTFGLVTKEAGDTVVFTWMITIG